MAGKGKEQTSSQSTIKLFSHMEHNCHRTMGSEVHPIENKTRKVARGRLYHILT